MITGHMNHKGEWTYFAYGVYPLKEYFKGSKGTGIAGLSKSYVLLPKEFC